MRFVRRYQCYYLGIGGDASVSVSELVVADMGLREPMIKGAMR